MSKKQLSPIEKKVRHLGRILRKIIKNKSMMNDSERTIGLIKRKIQILTVEIENDSS